MPRIFDNFSEKMQTALIQTLQTAERADFCVGYFNLRGWNLISDQIDHWDVAQGQQCRLLIGMNREPQEQVRELFSLNRDDSTLIDNQQVLRLRRQIVNSFRTQLMVGAPTNKDEVGLQQLVRQLRERKLVVKLFLRTPLHAKLYLMHRKDYSTPVHAYLGSSNLTLSGLSYQGELNTEVTEYDAGQKLAKWFEERWNETRCLDITQELIDVIEESWAREQTLSPYEVYLKMAYHLAQEAIAGVSGEFKLPREFATTLFDYQMAAVQIAAHHLNKRGGVILGDVVGLGKTLMATALARIFQDDYSFDTLVLCPKNLVSMWRKVMLDYRMVGEVIPLSRVIEELPRLRRYRLVIIDESHNLRNREGRRYHAIQEYIAQNESRCVLLSATPYNKSYQDLSAQLRLFIPEDRDLGIRPEHYLRKLGEAVFMQQHQTMIRSIGAFEKSDSTDDWRDLMRLYLVRRTRSFILNHYTETDPVTGRSFLRMRDGRVSYFPVRVPRTLRFALTPQYERLTSDEVISRITALRLPRYGLGQYVSDKAVKSATPEEKRFLEGLSRAGERLMGFSRTNLFKRLESSGAAFLQSLDRHILRNEIYLYAIENGLDLPIGTLEADALDSRTEDEDTDSLNSALELDEGPVLFDESVDGTAVATRAAYKVRAQHFYETFAQRYTRRFKWYRPTLFTADLKKALIKDSDHLVEVLRLCGEWRVEQDAKFQALHELIQRTHPHQKILVFSQFADTVRYLNEELTRCGVSHMAAATGTSENPTELAWRFSPRSNDVHVTPEEELRVLLSTDVLSEGQNLQDCAIVLNFDLPWAIIRLSQRAGRVDRIGQQSEQILCYSFLPAEGVERLIRLRARVKQRLAENGEVVGSDEQFFEDEAQNQQLRDLYTEKSGILDLEAETEVDLASYAYQIWTSATKDNPALAKKIMDLPDVVYSTRHYTGSVQRPQGVLVYMKTPDGTDSLGWIDENGQSVTQSHLAILRAAECPPGTAPIERHPTHHDLVVQAVEMMKQENLTTGGQLGRPNSPRRRTYDRLDAHLKYLKKHEPLFVSQELERAIDDLYRYPLRPTARDTLNRQLRSGIADEDLARLVMALRSEDRLSLIQEEGEQQEPRILCSLGLFAL